MARSRAPPTPFPSPGAPVVPLQNCPIATTLGISRAEVDAPGPPRHRLLSGRVVLPDSRRTTRDCFLERSRSASNSFPTSSSSSRVREQRAGGIPPIDSAPRGSRCGLSSRRWPSMGLRTTPNACSPTGGPATSRKSFLREWISCSAGLRTRHPGRRGRLPLGHNDCRPPRHA